MGLRSEDEGEDYTRAGRSVRLGGLGLGNFDGTRSERILGQRAYYYHCESQKEMQPGSGQILGAVLGSGPAWGFG